ncbi:hypothetical protein PMM47T1_23899 [Pseudomonas sp. M47T1]|nr:hypothetical protein PMM47T1_23899 [Pseudomonas sp. M47T1]
MGGLWILHLGVLPALAHVGLAPVLIEDIGAQIGTLLVGFCAFCVVVQALVLIRSLGVGALWRDMRGQLLSMALLAAALYGVVTGWSMEPLRWQVFCYLALGLVGLALVLQPVPGRARQARH